VAPVTPAGAKLEKHLTRAIAEFGTARQLEIKGQPMTTAKKSGGVFFSLIYEIEASERRLDEAAAPLLQKMQETEALAKGAVGTRLDRLDAAQDYIKRIQDVTDKLAEGNGGPSLVEGSAESPTPSDQPNNDGAK
jgi:hypothetical protein